MISHEGQLADFDHGTAWNLCEIGEQRPIAREAASAPLGLFIKRAPQATGSVGVWRDDPPLTRGELDRIRDRVDALRPRFDRRGRGHWLDYSLAALDAIRVRAPGQPGRKDER